MTVLLLSVSVLTDRTAVPHTSGQIHIFSMAVWQLAEERLLSGKGILQVSGFTEPFRQAILYADVVRPPRQEYLNLEYNPPKSLYARLAFCRDDYVLSYATMEARRSLFQTVNDVCGQTLIAIKCAYDGILESFDRQNAALGLVVLPRVDLIQDYANLRLAWNTIRVVCYKDCAVRLQLWVLPYDVCDPSRNEEQPPPESPAPPTPVGIGIPITTISPPYDDATNDGGNSLPNPIDDFDPEVTLPGELCTKYRIVVQYTRRPADGGGVTTAEAIVYGTVDEINVGVSSGSSFISALCRGYAFPTLDDGCQPEPVARTIRAGDVDVTQPVTVVSFTEV